MGLLSAFTLIRTISLFHLTVAYCFLTAPSIVADQNVVFILGESMRLNHATSLDRPSDASALIAILLAFLALADLTAASMHEEAALHYWACNVPVRLAFLFGLSGYVYLFQQHGALGSGSAARAGVGQPLQNSLVFSFAFCEMAAWFWIFTSLREERRRFAFKKAEGLKADQDRALYSSSL